MLQLKVLGDYSWGRKVCTTHFCLRFLDLSSEREKKQNANSKSRLEENNGEIKLRKKQHNKDKTKVINISLWGEVLYFIFYVSLEVGDSNDA